MTCDSCDKPATTCAHVELGGGYGQKVSGLAFYYACDKHQNRKVGDRTDMSRVVEVRLLEPSLKVVSPLKATGRRGVQGFRTQVVLDKGKVI